MALDLFLGQTKEDWSRDGRNGGRPFPATDAAAGAVLVGFAAVIAALKAPKKKDDQPQPEPLALSGDYEPYREEGGITAELPVFEPMTEVVGKRLR